MGAAALVAAVEAPVDGRILDAEVAHVVEAGSRRCGTVVALLLEKRLHVVLNRRLQ